MSKSQRRTPIFGIVRCHSEKPDKRRWHARLRQHEARALHRMSLEVADTHMTTTVRQVSDPWRMGKDGKVYGAPMQTRGRRPWHAK